MCTHAPFVYLGCTFGFFCFIVGRAPEKHALYTAAIAGWSAEMSIKDIRLLVGVTLG
jgi:hypothetical protein